MLHMSEQGKAIIFFLSQVIIWTAIFAGGFTGLYFGLRERNENSETNSAYIVDATNNTSTNTTNITAINITAIITNTTTKFTTKTASASGDPHFTVPLVSSNDTLCYSIQGYAGLAFNLISNSHLTVNALFTDSINDTKEVTWISKLAVIFHTSGQTIIFDSTHQQVFMTSMGKLKASIVKQIVLKESGQFAVKFSKKPLVKEELNFIEIVCKEIKFTARFHDDHLDVDWQFQDEQIIHSHGLMGQFMAKGIVVDQMKQILIRPDHPPVPVRLHHIWDYTHSNTDQLPPCWLVVNDGIQGEGLIDGNILDYVVDDLLQEQFTYTTSNQHH